MDKRDEETWQFLATICKRFDLVAIQEVMEDLSGLRKLKSLMGPDYSLIVSDPTGAFPGESGLAERLAFLYNWRMVERTELATDVSYDRSKVLQTLAENLDEVTAALEAYSNYLQAKKRGEDAKRPKIKMPEFLTFIRQPFCVSFRISGYPETVPYELMAINAHLYFGNYVTDRRQEFDALMRWILGRVRNDDTNYAANFMLLGDMNLDYDDPENDRARLLDFLKPVKTDLGRDVIVNFPFLDKHKDQGEVFTTNARQNQTFDQIGIFSRDRRWPEETQNEQMPLPTGEDYGVFNFVDLFAKALHGKTYRELLADGSFDKKAFFSRFEHNVSDHMPLWLRMPLPAMGSVP